MNKDDNMVELHYKNLSLDDIVYVDDNGVQCTEVWKDIPDYEGYYQVSDLGRVKSLSRLVRPLKKSYTTKCFILKTQLSKRGYICFTTLVGGKYKTFSVHQLMCICFRNHKPDGTFKIVVDHKNGCSIDNRLSNLQLLSNRENISKAIRPNKITDYVGVYSVKNGTYTSRIQHKGENIILGTFKTQEEASEYYQNALKAIENGEEIKHKRKEETSKYKGVSFAKKDKKWISEYYDNITRKSKRLGSFKTEKEAYEARENYIKNLNLQL